MTVLQALLEQGYEEHVARRHLRYFRVKVNGHTVSFPDYKLDDGDKVTVPELVMP
jgi:hypothetical protein